MKLTDLKLVDELLIDLMRSLGKQPCDMESHSSVTQYAMSRLRCAWMSGEMGAITATWADYFKKQEIQHEPMET